MASVTAFGGAFVRAKNPEALYSWYEKHLGLTRSQGSFAFPAAALRSPVLYVFFGEHDKYFPPEQPVMINLQVDDLNALLDRLIAEGVTVDPKRETYAFGSFGWCFDPEGNRIELWQPIPKA